MGNCPNFAFGFSVLTEELSISGWYGCHETSLTQDLWPCNRLTTSPVRESYTEKDESRKALINLGIL